MDKEFKKLQQENDKLRDRIEDILRELNIKDYKECWALIGKLINNEIEQEGYTGQ